MCSCWCRCMCSCCCCWCMLPEELLSAAAAECNPDPDVVWDFLQRTQDVLVAAGGLKETQDEDCRQQGLSQRLNAAFVLVRRVGINKAREQLTTSVAVLELACRFRPTQLAGLQGMFTPHCRWRPPSLAAQAFMVGILDGEALEARPDLLTDLHVPLVSMDLQTPAWREGAPTIGLPLAVYRFGDEGSCVAAPEGE
eukprot:XP_001703021.1 predicted protein [Chlamydomonas reinhardtii]